MMTLSATLVLPRQLRAAHPTLSSSPGLACLVGGCVQAQSLVDKYHSLWEKMQQRGTWLHIDVVLWGMEPKRFRLQCASCHDHIQLNIPSGFYQTHLKKCSDRGIGGIKYPESGTRPLRRIWLHMLTTISSLRLAS
jgi:hypothetical protein